MSSNILENLVNDAKKGNSEAFGTLYEMYCKDMYRFAYYYTGSEALAEDSVSEAVIIAFQKIKQLKKNASFKSWLFKILRNCCIYSLNNFKKQTEFKENSEIIHNKAYEQDEKISLQKALQGIAAQDREIIILYYCCGYTSKEIGDVLGLKDSTVRSKILRSTEKLKNELS